MITRNDAPMMPSNRSFGLLFTVVFAAAAAWLYLQGEFYPSAGFLGMSCLAGIAALVSPDSLAPFNRAWFLLGDALGKVVSPVVLGVIFFGIVTPIGLVCRLMGRDALRLKRHNKTSYWIERSVPGPDPDSFKNQF